MEPDGVVAKLDDDVPAMTASMDGSNFLNDFSNI
jgi:hypothetical protein